MYSNKLHFGEISIYLILLSVGQLTGALSLSMHYGDIPKSISATFSSKVQKFQKVFPSIVSTISIGAAVNSDIARAEEGASKGKLEYQPILQGLDYGKPRTYYPDYVQKKSGLQYKAVTEGTGQTPKVGDRVVVDWEGYTIGYYGRPFQTRNKVKGGAFESSEKDFFRWIVGSGSAVAAIDEAVQYMKEGSVFQVIVPAELGYPAQGDSEHSIVGPKPSTFSGLRALNFVLDNKNLIDKTLLINLKLIRVDKDYDKNNRGKDSV